MLLIKKYLKPVQGVSASHLGFIQQSSLLPSSCIHYMVSHKAMMRLRLLASALSPFNILCIWLPEFSFKRTSLVIHLFNNL